MEVEFGREVLRFHLCMDSTMASHLHEVEVSSSRSLTFLLESYLSITTVAFLLSASMVLPDPHLLLYTTPL